MSKQFKNKNYERIMVALDHKADVKSYFELLQHTSGLVRKIAPPILYNKLGQTWEGKIEREMPVETPSMQFVGDNFNNPDNLT